MPPIASIVTITKERRHFFPHLIHTVKKQSIPEEYIEWIIIEDGADNIFDLVKDIPTVKYFRLSGVNTIGYKRNYANSKVSGKYIFYLDDDNYAFPHRLECSIKAFENNISAMLVGSSDMYIYDNTIKKAYVCGPFGENHSTLGTWGCRREILEITSFNSTDSKSEELEFTKHWTLPMVQIGRDNTSISFDHGKNTISKQHLKLQANSYFNLNNIISDPISLEFFTNFKH